MNYSLSIPESELVKLAHTVEGRLHAARTHVQGAMGETFKDIVMRNFGPDGIDRPFPWQPLSNNYANKVGRAYATLRETGLMQSAVKLNHTEDASTVSLSEADCPYATYHHFGDGNLPHRRVFPIRMDGTITDYTHDSVMESAFHAMEEALR